MEQTAAQDGTRTTSSGGREPHELLVIGCGNILRGDDAVGPILVRHLFTLGVPDGVRLVDGGTAGMDVAFSMRGAGRVVIVDASATGAEPGTRYRVPAEALAALPPIDGLHTHNFRWDHALSFSTWLLGPQRPDDITVFLVEAGSMEPGAPLTPPVQLAMEQVAAMIVRDFFPDPPSVEITASGYLHIAGPLAATYFPADVCVARLDPGDGTEVLELMPIRGAGNGGMVLKQCRPDGERSLLVSEVLGFEDRRGRYAVTWEELRGVLKVDLGVDLTPPAEGQDHVTDPGPRPSSGHSYESVGGPEGRPGGGDGGGGRAREMVGLPAGGEPGGRGPATPHDSPPRAHGTAERQRGPSYGGPTTDPSEGAR